MSLRSFCGKARTGLLTVALAAGLALSGAAAAWAAETGWTVTFTGDKMESDGTADVLAQVKKRKNWKKSCVWQFKEQKYN